MALLTHSFYYLQATSYPSVSAACPTTPCVLSTRAGRISGGPIHPKKENRLRKEEVVKVRKKNFFLEGP